jgi:hypothetical protein
MPKPKPMPKQPATLADLHPDPKNARKHTPRNVGSIVDALNKVGAARSIVIDEDNTILAGNATAEAAGQAGIENVMVVEADGNTIVAVRRTGLTKKQKAQLAICDNRTAELAEWDVPALTGLADEVGLDLTEVEFTPDEVSQLGNEFLPLPDGAGGKEYDESVADDVKLCTCPKCGHEFPA